MVDQAVAEQDDDLGEVEERPATGRMAGKTLVLFIVLPILLLIGGGAGAYLSGLLDPLLGKGEVHEEDAEADVAKPMASVFYDLPEMLVNLNGNGRRSAYLKISVSLELADNTNLEHVDQMLPRIVDNFQVYLRELRIEDLSGSAGLQRLREELLLRVNTAVHPVEIRGVLFKEMLVQ